MWTCPQCGQENGAGLVACSNCGRKNDTPAPPTPSSSRPPVVRRSLLLIVGVVLLGAIVAALAVPAYLAARRAGSEQGATAVLKTITMAQADFRANDRDDNHVHEFWTGDVAGLYCIGDPPIRLIELATAAADTAPIRQAGSPYSRSIRDFAEAAPRAGYWYGVLEFDGTNLPPKPYRQPSQGTPSAGKYYNARRFGHIAYPDEPGSSGDRVYVINERNTVYRRPAPETIRPSDRNPPGAVTDPGFTSWPNEAERMFHWSRAE